jgi:hypothetical protein
MTSSEAFISSTGLPTLDRSAECANCHRLGTVAIAATGSSPLERYCRRCWPSAQRRILEQQAKEGERYVAELHERFQAGDLTNAPPAPAGLSMEWHWTTLPGSLLRQLWYSRRARDSRSNEEL